MPAPANVHSQTPHTLHAIDVRARMIAGVDRIAKRLEQEGQRTIGRAQIEQRSSRVHLRQGKSGFPAEPLQGEQVSE